MRLDEAVAAAEQIAGWMQPEELRWLGEQAETRHRIVEIGSWQGRSTKVLALMTAGSVIAVDNLAGEEGSIYGAEQEAAFRENLAPELERGKVELMTCTSLEAAERFRGEADMIFIDGRHEYPAPLWDIRSWEPHLADGGLLCGHDSTIPGVYRSLVDRFGETWRSAGPGSLWYADLSAVPA